MKVLLFSFVLSAVALCSGQRKYYSLHDMPHTKFDCRDKILGGYYADPETNCQMFHVCVKIPGLGVQDFRFLCPNETVFDQENTLCVDSGDVDCAASGLYLENFDLYRIGQGPTKLHPSTGKTATPLGPATKSSILTNNINEDDEFYLQRSETGDRRSQGKDLLRGSSSSNFFNNRNNGKDLDDDEPSYSQPAIPQRSQNEQRLSYKPKSSQPIRGKSQYNPQYRKNTSTNTPQVPSSTTLQPTQYSTEPSTQRPQYTRVQSQPFRQQTRPQQYQTSSTPAQTTTVNQPSSFQPINVPNQPEETAQNYDPQGVEKKSRKVSIRKLPRKRTSTENYEKLTTPGFSQPTVSPSSFTTQVTNKFVFGQNENGQKYNTIQRQGTTIAPSTAQRNVQQGNFRNRNEQTTGAFFEPNPNKKYGASYNANQKNFNQNQQSNGNFNQEQNYNVNQQSQPANYNQQPTNVNQQNQQSNVNQQQQQNQQNNYNQNQQKNNFNQQSSFQPNRQTPEPSVDNTSQRQAYTNVRQNSQQPFSRQTSPQTTQNQHQTSPQPTQNFNNQRQTSPQPFQNFNNQRQTSAQPTQNFNQRQTSPQPTQNFNQRQTSPQPTQNFNQRQTSPQPTQNFNNQRQNAPQSAQNFNNQRETSQQHFNNQRQTSQAPFNSRSGITNARPISETTQNYRHQTRDDFEEDNTQEFLKTAQSNNYRPSHLNSFQNNYKQNEFYNKNTTYKSEQTTPKVNYYTPTVITTSTKQFYTTTPAYTEQTTKNTVFYSPTVSTTYKSTNFPNADQTTFNNGPNSSKQQQQQQQFSPSLSSSTARPQSSNDNAKKDYDYAYYDDAGAFSEYDALDALGETDFSRTSQRTKSRLI